jgi:DNA invertase Pin-like site-specific DNA recombinase
MVGELPKWMSKAEPFVYARISTQEQAEKDIGKPLDQQTPMMEQVAEIKAKLKALGFKEPKKENMFYDIASGYTMDRDNFKAMIAKVLAYPKRAYIVIREPARWSRNQVLGTEIQAELYRRNIPILEAQNGLLSSTQEEPRAYEQFMFSIGQGISTIELDVKKKKNIQKVESFREQGIYASGAATLYPFAKRDPLEVMEQNYDLLTLTKAEGGGHTAFGNLLIASTAPHGMTTINQYPRLKKADDDARANLSPEEYKAWRAFRSKIRDMYREKGYDPSPYAVLSTTKPNKNYIDWGLKAVQRMVSGFIQFPTNPIYRMPTDEELNDYYTNFKDWLSDGDLKLYRRVVSKR